MIGRILVGLDGSKISKVAGEYGIYLSKKLKKPVIGVHIIDIRLLEGPFLSDIAGGLGFTVYGDLTAKIKEILDVKANAILDEFAVRCREKEGNCSIASAYGVVVDELVNMADPEDILIVGKKGEHESFVPLFLGSTAEAVAKKASCPVMITPTEFKEINSILLAFDGREKSVHATVYVNHLAKTLKIDSIKVISVFKDKVKDQQLVETFKERLNSLIEVPYEFIDKYGLPEEMLDEYINENKDNLGIVVMGAFGESMIKELILGSTTNYIVSRSPVPVLLVK